MVSDGKNAADAAPSRVRPNVNEAVLPAADFQIYGIAGPSDEVRWLDLIVGMWAGVWLGHSSAVDQSGTLVGTFPRKEFDSWSRLAVESGGAIAVAMEGMARLMEVVSPEPSVARPPGIGNAILSHLEAAARSQENWARVTWLADGNDIGARIWSFAGAWIGMTEAVESAHVLVVGTGMTPETVHLITVNDTAYYGVDLSRPLRQSDVLSHRSRNMIVPHPNRFEWHADQLALI